MPPWPETATEASEEDKGEGRGHPRHGNTLAAAAQPADPRHHEKN